MGKRFRFAFGRKQAVRKKPGPQRTKLALQPLEPRYCLSGLSVLSLDVDLDNTGSLGLPQVTVSEGAGAVVIPVRRDGMANQEVSVRYTTRSVEFDFRSAVEGEDYTAVDQRLTFAAFATQAFITVPIVNDSVLEPSEYFIVDLSEPSVGAELSNDFRAKSVEVLIDDNEPATVDTPNFAYLPGSALNALHFTPDGRLTELVWLGEDLVFRVRQDSGQWTEELVTTDIITGDGFFNQQRGFRDFEQAQLLFDSAGVPHVLLVGREGVEHHRRGPSGWEFVENVPTKLGEDFVTDFQMAAAIGPGNVLHFATMQRALDIEPRIVYGTNKSGTWTVQVVTQTKVDFQSSFFSFTPRYFSLAVDSQNFAHVAFTPEFVSEPVPGGTRVFSRLDYASNRSGNWVSETVFTPPDNSADAGLGSSVAIGPGDQVAIASFFVERAPTGSGGNSQLFYHVRQPSGGWARELVASAPDGYAAADGPHFTGASPLLRFDHLGRPNIVFSDHASQHFPITGADEFAGQIRHARRTPGGWQLQTVFRQTDPIRNQIVFPTMALSPFEIAFAGLVQHDTLRPDFSIERSDFTHLLISVPLGPADPELRAFYDEALYLAANPDVRAAALAGALPNGFAHFVQFGHREGRRANEFFDESLYRALNPDVAAAIAQGVLGSGYEHFARAGHREGRRFSLFFEEAAYRAANPDVAAAIASGGLPSGFLHFVQSGRREGRRFHSLYDEAFYLAQNPDVAAAVNQGAFPSGLAHFIAFGQREGRRFSRLFDEQLYRADHPDVAQAVANGALRSGLEHYLRFGRAEGRLARPLYDEAVYLAANPDVAQAVANGAYSSGFQHFVLHGRHEMRRFSPFFDEVFYLQQYPDVAQAVANGALPSGYDHFVRFGQWEGRQGAPPM